MDAGGQIIQAQSDMWVNKNGPVPIGGIATTVGGSLKCKQVIHAVPPMFRKYSDLTEQREVFVKLSTCVKSVLNRANKIPGVKTISIPEFNQGFSVFPPAWLAEIVLCTCVDWFKSNGDFSDLQEIRICVPDP